MNGRVMVLAVGNPDRGDDGIGPHVAARLDGLLPAGVDLLICTGDLLSVMERWDGLDALVAVDAAASMGEPGRVHRLEPERDALPAAPATSSHALGLAEALALATALGSAPGRTVVFAIEGAGFEVGAPLSPGVAAAAEAAASAVLAELAALAGAIDA